MPTRPRSVLFVCYANACRSQMAETYARCRLPEGVEVQSAGMIAAGIHPRAARAVEAWGLDMRLQRSKTIESLDAASFDLVISLSDHARRRCDELCASSERLHWPILDPVGVRGRDAEKDELFALTRDDIAEAIDALLEERFEPGELRPRPPGSAGEAD